MTGVAIEEWERLARETLAGPWAWPGWFEAWARAFAPGEELVVHGVRAEGRLRGVGVFRRRGRRLEAAANVHSPWWGVVAADDETRKRVIADAVADGPAGVVLRQVRDDAEANAVPAGCRTVRRVIERAPFVQVTADWDAYAHATITRHQRLEIERCKRRLSEEGALQYEWLAPSPDAIDALLDEGFRVEGSGWKARAGTAIDSQPETASFYRDVARWAATRGWLRLGFLRVGTRPLAFELAFEQEGVVSLVKGGYDESSARFGPGIVLLRELLQDAFERGVREVDLLGSSEPYKLRWAHGTRERSELAVLPATPRGTAEYVARRVVLGARSAARPLVRIRR
jgi:CelD/BcsL family acetyltransferase involved in cellulose biosynthesis